MGLLSQKQFSELSAACGITLEGPGCSNSTVMPSLTAESNLLSNLSSFPFTTLLKNVLRYAQGPDRPWK
jgi:hypothetical protein